MYQLFCDSNCELWHTEAKELGLQVIRMPYVLDGEEHAYDLGEHTDFKHFFILAVCSWQINAGFGLCWSRL